MTKPTPLHELPRHVAIPARFADDRFMKAFAPLAVANAVGRMEDELPRLAEFMAPMPMMPGLSFGASPDRRVLVVTDDATGELVAGVAQGVIWTSEDRRGSGIGRETLILAFETGVKQAGEPVFFSPEGYANRSSAHRLAVARAIASGKRVPPEVAQPYAAPAEPAPAPRRRRQRLPRIPLLDGRSLADLRVAAGRFRDAVEFARDSIEMDDDPATRIEIFDSVGRHLMVASPETAARFAPLREYTLRALVPSPGEMEAHATRLAARAELVALWNGWADRDELGFAGRDQLREAIAYDHRGALLPFLGAVMSELGADAFRLSGFLPWRSPSAGRFEMMTTAGRATIEAHVLLSRHDAQGPLISVLRARADGWSTEELVDLLGSAAAVNGIEADFGAAAAAEPTAPAMAP